MGDRPSDDPPCPLRAGIKPHTLCKLILHLSYEQITFWGMYCGHPETIIWSSLSRVPSEIPSQERSPVFLLLPSLGDPGPVDPETVGIDDRVALGGSNWSLLRGHKGPNGASWSHVPGISWAFSDRFCTEF